MIDINKYIEWLQKKFDAKPFNFKLNNSFEKVLQDIDNESFLLIAGRTSTGKSALALQINNNLLQQKLKGLYISTEMGQNHIFTRIISNVLEIDYNILAHPSAFKDQRDQTINIINDKKDKLKLIIENLDIWDKIKTSNAEEFISQLDKKIKDNNYNYIIIDYLQQLASMWSIGIDELRNLNYLSTNLQRLTREYKIPIICVVQINRVGGETERNAPELKDIKGSGSLEQDADIVLLLYKNSKDDYQRFINIAKNRNGSTDTITIGWEGKLQKFYEEGKEI